MRDYMLTFQGQWGSTEEPQIGDVNGNFNFLRDRFLRDYYDVQMTMQV